MQRYVSKTSLADSTISSRITKTNHSHVIIQTDNGNKGAIKYILLPVKNLVNFGRPFKTNDLVTYKIDLKCRGTNRGKIILFGSEGDCGEQIQILSSVGDENDAEISAISDVINTSDQQACQKESYNQGSGEYGINKENVGKQQPSTEMDKNQSSVQMGKKPYSAPINKKQTSIQMNKKQSAIQMNKKQGKITEPDSFERQSKTTENLDNHQSIKKQTIRKIKMPKTFDDEMSSNTSSSTFESGAHSKKKGTEQPLVQKPSNISMVTKKTNVGREAGGQKTLDQMLKKVVVGTSSTCKSTITYESSTRSPSITNNNMNTSKNSRKTQDFSASLRQLTTNSKEQQQMSPQGDTFSIDGENDKIHETTYQMTTDPCVEDEEYLSNNYNKLLRDKTALEIKYSKLLKAYKRLMANSLPMPDDSAKQWLIHVGTLIGPKRAQFNTDTIAEELGITKPSLLTSCIRDTPSNTTRQVIKLLYPPAELETKRGTAVTTQQRKVIRAFVQKENGPIANRSFREAINGVFRNYAHKSKKAEGMTKKKNSTMVQNQEDELSVDPAVDEESPCHLEYDEEEEEEIEDDENDEF